jgi:hypothetical protein
VSIVDKVVKLEKRIERLASRKDAPVTALEIRRAILDDIEEQVAPAGRSRRVFPYDQISIEVVGAADSRASASSTSRRTARPLVPMRAELEAVLDPDAGFADAIRERLQDAGCERIRPLNVSVNVLKKARPDWKEGILFRVAYDRAQAAAAAQVPARERAAAPSATPSTGAVRAAQILVLDGEATKKAYTLSGERTNIGRLAEVTDKHRRVVRRNQIVFLDADSETNQTVSRAQAHISFTPPAEYRLFDDHSSYGTRIVRGGRMIDLPSGSPRGARLQAGDEIYFGRARVVFQLK